MENRVVCTHCGGVNRIPEARDGGRAKCGSCGAKLFEGRPAEVDGAMFDRQIGRGTLPVLVNVWAPWCGPCRMMAPAYEAAAGHLEPHMRLLKLNSDDEQQVSARLGIRGIPTMLLYYGGREVDRVSGAHTERQIVGWARERMAGARQA